MIAAAADTAAERMNVSILDVLINFGAGTFGPIVMQHGIGFFRAITGRATLGLIDGSTM